MESEAAARRQPAIARPPRDSALAWRDLRDWIAQIEQHGELARVTAMVDPHEELCAVTLLASRQDKSPALIFEKMQGDTTGSRIPYKHAWRQRRALRAGGGARSIRKHA